MLNWNNEATGIIKAAKARQRLEWSDIADLLHQRLGVELSPDTIKVRVNKGAFSFALALQILAVLDVKEIPVPQIPEE